VPEATGIGCRAQLETGYLAMNKFVIAAVILIAIGTAGLIYGQFSYVKESHDVELGPIEFSVQERETVNIPTWAGAGVVAAGTALLVFGVRKR